jgi:hypothetical protein
MACKKCGGEGGDFVGTPTAEQDHYAARLLWVSHKYRQALAKSASEVLVDAVSDIIRKAEDVVSCMVEWRHH